MQTLPQLCFNPLTASLLSACLPPLGTLPALENLPCPTEAGCVSILVLACLLVTKLHCPIGWVTTVHSGALASPPFLWHRGQLLLALHDAENVKGLQTLPFFLL